MKRIVLFLILTFVPYFSFVSLACKPMTEQEFVNFLASLTTVQSAKSGREKVDSVVRPLRKDLSKLDEVLDWAAKYLLDESSPMYSPRLYDSLFIMGKYGRKPLDFRFRDDSGSETTLYKAYPNGGVTLFFYAADCDHCMSLLRQWKDKSHLMSEELRGDSVLAVCVGGDDRLWHESIMLMPHNWRAVRDLDELIVRRRYDLRVLPYIYKP